MLWAQAGAQQQGPEITKEMIAGAEEIAGLKFTDEERTSMDASGTSRPAPVTVPLPTSIAFLGPIYQD